MTQSRHLRSLHRVSLLEGISLLLLLGVAMPLKYAFGMPLAVRIAGLTHGLLFLWLLQCAWVAYLEQALPPRRLLAIAGLAVVPFGFIPARRWLEPGSKPSADEAVQQTPPQTK
jgi:integral membrane protein